MLKLGKVLGDPNERELKKLRPIVDEVNDLEPEFEALSDEGLLDKTEEFRDRIADGESLEDVLPEAFALVREGAKRTLGQRHYDVQIMGGCILHQGKVAEMRTGEGKTLVATLPVYLNALEGKGVHVVTVNDYLARRDAQWMGQIYQKLGLTIACLQHDNSLRLKDDGELEAVNRQDAYAADITYGTNSELGFDYLRDNMVHDLKQLVQRPLNYCIIDEVDNILIDEARTPLIISGQSNDSAKEYQKFARLAPSLRDEDYTIDEKLRSVSLTASGIEKLERRLGVTNLYDESDDNLNPRYADNALKAHALYHKDREYVVRDGEVVIVDEFTGRLMPGRRYSDGLHQAIEAKERLKVRAESITMATVTLQNYFRMYEKLAGMTGTAATESEELYKIYELDVLVVPTHMPMVRADEKDVIYTTEEAKFKAVADEIEEHHNAGRPVLVGTVSIEKSDLLSKHLKKRGIKHEVLNAKYHEREAAIVAQAGRVGAVTVATNMAGRGTDIVLGGAQAPATSRQLPAGRDTDAQAEATSRQLPAGRGTDAQAPATSRQLPAGRGTDAQTTATSRQLPAGRSTDAQAAATSQQLPAGRGTDIVLSRAQADRESDEWQAEHDKVVDLGGLMIIGTERHEARRIDNQLRGRAGRQGDPGETRFYLSLEDELMRRAGGDTAKKFMDWAGLPEETPIESGMVSKVIENAQTKVEGHNFDIRKHLLQYDDVVNKHREVIYGERRKILEGADVKANILDLVKKELDVLVDTHLVGEDLESWDVEALLNGLRSMFPVPRGMTEESISRLSKDQARDAIKDYAEKLYEQREAEVGAETMRALERWVMLRGFDARWIRHLTDMENLRQGIGLQGVAQLDPLVAYKRQGHAMFDELMDRIRQDVARMIFQVGVRPAANGASAGVVARPAAVEQAPEQRQMAAAAGRRAKGAGRSNKIGRNDPCHCGSGKKYKKCCGAAA